MKIVNTSELFLRKSSYENIYQQFDEQFTELEKHPEAILK